MSLHEPAEMMKMVAYLSRHGPSAIREVERDLGIPYTTIRRRFSIWIEEGFLVKEARQTDSRNKWQYHLTDKGEKIGEIMGATITEEKPEETVEEPNQPGVTEPSEMRKGGNNPEANEDTVLFTSEEICEILAEIREDIFSLAMKARDERSLQNTFTDYIYKSYGYEI